MTRGTWWRPVPIHHWDAVVSAPFEWVRGMVQAISLSANERVAVIPMIETKEALEQVEEIAAVPGVDALFVGPFDLSIALGLSPGDNDGTPLFDDAIDRVIKAANQHKLALAVLSNAAVAPLRVKQGFQMISVTTDIQALTAASARSLALVREKMLKP